MIKKLVERYPHISWECVKNGMSWTYSGIDANGNEYMVYATSCLPFGSDDERDAYTQWYMMVNGKSKELPPFPIYLDNLTYLKSLFGRFRK